MKEIYVRVNLYGLTGQTVKEVIYYKSKLKQQELRKQIREKHSWDKTSFDWLDKETEGNTFIKFK